MAEKKMVDVFSDIERETAMTANPAGYAVTELGAQDERIVTLAADMSNTVAEFIEKFPERYIECGIAETVARAGLSVHLDQVALPDKDLEVGVPAELYEYYGLTPSNVAAKARNLVRR